MDNNNNKISPETWSKIIQIAISILTIISGMILESCTHIADAGMAMLIR